MISGRKLRSLLCAVLSALMFCLAAVPAGAASLEELQKEQESLRQQKEETDARLEELREDTDRRRAYRDALYQQISTVQGQLDLLRQQIDGLNARIAQGLDGIAEKQERIDRNMDLLKERIRALYVTGDASTLALVMDSKNLMDFTEKVQLLRAVTRHDKELIATLTGQMKEIQEELDRINADKRELSQDKKDLDAKGAELTELYAEAQRLVDDAENEELNAQTNSDLLGSRMEENQAAITQLEEELKAQAAKAPGGSGYVGTGSFIWPMPGYTYLTCYFGEGGHRGVDIAGGDIYGKAIVAADGGTVTYAGWNDSYGWCVFLDHGNGYETRYAHMSALGVDTGDAVEQGQVIGYVGSTGNSTGPHLHFEVIAGGSLTDPMGYF